MSMSRTFAQFNETNIYRIPTLSCSQTMPHPIYIMYFNMRPKIIPLHSKKKNKKKSGL